MRRLRHTGVVFALLAGLAFHQARAAEGYGQCRLFGHGATHHVTPAVPGQLTVLINLPAVGEFDGDTPTTIRSGREFCLAVNIAYRLGLDRVVLRNASFDSLVAGRNRDYDLALALVSVRHRDHEVVTFSAPYAFDSYGIATRATTRMDENTLRAARVGTQLGTNVTSWARDSLKIRRLSAFDDTGTMFTALAAGNVDAVITSLSVILGQVGAAQGRFRVVGQFPEGTPIAAVLPLHSPEAPVIDRIINDMRTEGTLRALDMTYLAPLWKGADPSTIPVWH
ncbi:type 2 periplasmic-binding domain-containing protein [Novacetimonas pomaceti]|uniref:Amino acid ABC transporter substrate-binding protein n=1 Tax=Novacetimonas pomaceti TaxID=2021998 RepID=A0ABX5P5F4_9PROT|nr:transporter substrate-binding domain-containing protein [Novacetimonas pomaceti]PYD49020.1 amino acid ABC transporter substrate-binding protein [Novacetimonas pomaceti]